MEVLGKSMVAVPTNVIYLSTILGQDGPNPVHKCDWKCENEHVCGNMFRCRLTGLTHICDKNCNQRILYDNHNSLCRVSRQVFPLTQVEVQAVKGVRRKFDADSSPSDSCAFKRRRDAHFHPSPFERSFTAIHALPRGLEFEQIESALSFELLNRERSEEESNICQINWCFASMLKCDYPAVTFVPEEESLAAKSRGVAKPLKVTPVVQFAPLLLQKKRKDLFFVESA